MTQKEVTQKEAYEAFILVLQFLTQNTSDTSVICGCHKIEDFFLEHSVKKAEQTKISDFLLLICCYKDVAFE